jgi:predicted nucleic acid-binding protein
MRLEEALRGVSSILLDTTPAIYYIEGHPTHRSILDAFFGARRRAGILLVTSPITLAECLVHPVARGLANLTASYDRLLLRGEGTRFVPIGESEAVLAARIRASYGLRLPDALQVAVAVTAGCQAILTNDAAFHRVRDVRSLLLGELEL